MCIIYSETSLLCNYQLFTSIEKILTGSISYSGCTIQEVPLYLIVGGILLLIDIILQTVLLTAHKLTDSNIYTLIRKCDCVALCLVVWLVAGSIWIFKARTRQGCNDAVDYVTVGNQTDDIIMDMSADGGMGDLESANCGVQDCPAGVYLFTVFLILFQYLLLLIIGIFCCTAVMNARSPQRRHHSN